MNDLLRVRFELLSDAIFGSGYSVPGEEDISVCMDSDGYPYIRGSTVKGLLRESLENWCAWTGEDTARLSELFGESDWNGGAPARRVRFTALTLDAKPQDPAECFEARTFTELENGAAKPRSLRSARCICRGQSFSGEIWCESGDRELLQKGLCAIKWVGTLRGRGFGRVRVSAQTGAADGKESVLSAGNCIHYCLPTEQPVRITDLSRSGGNIYETRGLLPGSAIRGMVMSALAEREPAFFAENRMALLSEETQFSDAVPRPEGGENLPVLPAVMGFYEDKGETALEHVLVRNGDLTPGYKRAKTGSFCALREDIISWWSASSDSTLRLNREMEAADCLPFQTRYLDAGQDFDGYIFLKDPALAPMIARAFSPPVFLGADRYAGFGKCSVAALETTGRPAYEEAYSFRAQEEIGREVYLLAVSPFTMLNASGEPCGLDWEQLAEKIGAGAIEPGVSSTSLTECGGYNRTWGCRSPAVLMYARGSLFQLRCAAAPALEKLLAVQRDGLGIRRAEGFGRVLFLPPETVRRITRKQKVEAPPSPRRQAVARARRARCRWVMNKAGELRGYRLSKSQLGSIQTFCEEAIASKNTAALESHLQKNLTERGAQHGVRFKEIDRLVRQVLDTPLPETIGEACEDSLRARLELLCMLFDFSRKNGEEDT